MRALAVFSGVLAAGCGGGAPASAPQDGGHISHDATAITDGPAASDATSSADSPTDAGLAAEAAGPPARLVAYASGYGPNIQWLSVDPDSGAVTPAGSIASFGDAPSFLATDPARTHLYAVDEATPGQIGAYSIDPTTGALTFQNAVASGGDGPPFVAVDGLGRWVLVANYTSGTVAVLPIQGDGSLAAAVTTLAAGTESHMILPDPSEQFVFVPCLGSDYVAQYVFDASAGSLAPNAAPHLATAADAGPRHLAFHPNGKVAYLIDEVASTMSELSFDEATGTLAIVQTVSTLPAGFTGTNTAAEVHVHPSGKWLFGSNRGDDSIVVFALDASGAMTVHGFTPSGGQTPRDFSLDPSGRFLYAANETTGNVVAFQFDGDAGSLAQVGSPVTVPSASFVGVVPLP